MENNTIDLIYVVQYTIRALCFIEFRNAVRIKKKLPLHRNF